MEMKSWQRKAIAAERINRRLVVSTPRQAGKSTLLAQVIVERAKSGDRVFNFHTYHLECFKYLISRIKSELEWNKFKLEDFEFHYISSPKSSDIFKLYCDEKIPDYHTFFAVITKPYVELSFDINDITEEHPHMRFTDLLEAKQIMNDTTFQEDFMGMPK